MLFIGSYKIGSVVVFCQVGGFFDVYFFMFQFFVYLFYFMVVYVVCYGVFILVFELLLQGVDIYIGMVCYFVDIGNGVEIGFDVIVGMVQGLLVGVVVLLICQV